jgi:tRNA (guanosine-2'-O-)-methyltransferase
VNAILRSCDAVGVLTVHFLYTIEKFPKLAQGTSSGAYKWLDYVRWTSVAECFGHLKQEGFQVLATRLEPGARQLYDFDLARPTALVLGNEHRGISEEAATLADELVYIPMLGMVESLNVSVAAAVTLFEALRQRRVAGFYEAPQLTPEALRSKRLEWLLR